MDRSRGPEGDAVEDAVGSGAGGRRHAGSGLHRVVACAAHDLFSGSHAGRYFGGLWFKVFSERGPC